MVSGRPTDWLWDKTLKVSGRPTDWLWGKTFMVSGRPTDWLCDKTLMVSGRSTDWLCDKTLMVSGRPTDWLWDKTLLVTGRPTDWLWDETLMVYYVGAVTVPSVTPARQTPTLDLTQWNTDIHCYDPCAVDLAWIKLITPCMASLENRTVTLDDK
jgi:hypothetical protein